MESLTKREQPDRSKINADRPRELKYWTRALGVAKEDLLAAIDKVGNYAAIDRKELERIEMVKAERKEEEERIQKSAECAREARHQAALLPEGPVRDALQEKAQQYEIDIPEDKQYI